MKRPSLFPLTPVPFIASLLLLLLLPIALGHPNPLQPASPLVSIPPGTSFQIQLSGDVDTSLPARVYELDLFDTPRETISYLKSRGSIVICYFSAGSFEDWREDACAFPNHVKGKKLDDWPGECWLDVRDTNALGPIMRARLLLAKSKGCDGVDPDNMDAFSNKASKTGFPISSSDQLTYNRLIADTAHSLSLLVALKNCQDLARDLLPWFDFLVTEECVQYRECEQGTVFVRAGKANFNIEYKGSLQHICRTTNALNIDAQKKHIDLDARRELCKTYGDIGGGSGARGSAGAGASGPANGTDGAGAGGGRGIGDVIGKILFGRQME
ncbi:glycoside hydrolase family 114 protein [Gonapodya prolifera JEL478]|uniref:alpha-galactosidase n=1 Tax=Gonapodya prolifera (strain JEL478) TaxID=1344416 RepID=A0A139AK57_GONPJ|nr:glycoside hydrolase family 114 protein [Gonapodya prolifera JEL478]|eukprot:KXS17159.1 glycoside hydrolase family 114 protein [Gonapodya prolifera JEL478]